MLLNNVRSHTRTVAVFCALFAFLINQLPVAAAASAVSPVSNAALASLGDVLDQDGALVAGGFSGTLDATGYALTTSPSGAPRFVRATAQVRADQQWDDRFGVPGVQGGWGEVRSVAVNSAGHLIVAGSFNDAGSLEANNIARWDGRKWNALGAGLDGPVNQILVVGNLVYAVGVFEQAGGVQANQIAKWDGTRWSAVGRGVGVDVWEGEVHTIARIGTSLYIGGRFDTVDGVAARNIARWDGARWLPLAHGVGYLDWEETDLEDGSGEVSTLLAAPGKLYVGGDFEAAGNPAQLVRANSIAVWNGTRWSALGTGVIDAESDTNGEVDALAISGNMLYAGGEFTKAGGKAANNIAVWNGTAWNAVGLGVRDTTDSLTPVQEIMIDGTKVVAGGYFNNAGGKAANGLATWDTAAQTWTPMAPALEPDAEVMALLRAADGSLIVGGSFDEAGGSWVQSIARLDATGWRAFGQGLGDWSYDHTGTLYAVAVDRAGRIFVGGDFQRAGGVAVTNIAMWDGTRWNNIGAVDDTVRALVVVGDDVYVGGDFTRAGGVAAGHVARWNRLTNKWSALGSGVNGEVNALVYDANRLYVGGNFTAAGGIAAYDVAYWEASKWRPFGTKFRIYERFDSGSERNTVVQALAVSGDDIVIGGSFQTMHVLGSPTMPLENYRLVNNVVRWNRATDSWSMLGKLTATEEPGVTENGFTGWGTGVNALAIAHNSVYIGGSFNQAGTTAANGIVRWKAANNTWAAMGPGVGAASDPEVHALTVVGNDLFVGGHFTTAGPAAANFVARYHTLGGTWSALGSGVMSSAPQWTEVYGIAASSTAAYFVGDFYTAGGRSSFGFAQWNAYARTGTITNAGGTFMSGEGIQAQFPSGAFKADTAVTYTARFNASRTLPAKNVFLRGGVFRAVTGGTANTTTAKPYTLRMPYTGAWLGAAGVTPTTLNIVRLDGTTWVPMLPCTGCSVDTTNRVVTVVTNQLGEFALVGKLP